MDHAGAVAPPPPPTQTAPQDTVSSETPSQNGPYHLGRRARAPATWWEAPWRMTAPVVPLEREEEATVVAGTSLKDAAVVAAPGGGGQRRGGRLGATP